VRTLRYTYARDLSGAWLLYDNLTDPFQRDNLVNLASHAVAQAALDAQLDRLLALYDDEFLPGPVYVNLWDYPLDDTGTVLFTDVPS